MHGLTEARAPLTRHAADKVYGLQHTGAVHTLVLDKVVRHLKFRHAFGQHGQAPSDESHVGARLDRTRRFVQAALKGDESHFVTDSVFLVSLDRGEVGTRYVYFIAVKVGVAILLGLCATVVLAVVVGDNALADHVDVVPEGRLLRVERALATVADEKPRVDFLQNFNP